MSDVIVDLSRFSRDDEKKEDDCWGKVPEVLLRMILSRVHYSSYHKVRATCTKWRSLTPPLQLTPHHPYYQSPCLLIHGSCRTTTDFFNPMYNITYNSSIDISAGLSGTSRIYSFNHGWLLMGSEEDGGEVFFLDPFTKVRIELPSLPPMITFEKMSFSSSPTSSDCRVTGLWGGYTTYTVGIIKRGEEDWTIHDLEFEVRTTRKFMLSDSNPVLHNGRYYCLDLKGGLAVFNPEDVSESTFYFYPQHLPSKLLKTLRQCFILESDGDILSVYVYRGGDRHVCVYKLDFSRMIWERVEDLGDKTLYISNTTSFSTTSSVAGGGGGGLMGNRIYFPRFCGEDGLFYSLVTKRYHVYHDDLCQSPREIKELKEYRSATWMLPQFASISARLDLKW